MGKDRGESRNADWRSLLLKILDSPQQPTAATVDEVLAVTRPPLAKLTSAVFRGLGGGARGAATIEALFTEDGQRKAKKQHDLGLVGRLDGWLVDAHRKGTNPLKAKTYGFVDHAVLLLHPPRRDKDPAPVRVWVTLTPKGTLRLGLGFFAGNGAKASEVVARVKALVDVGAWSGPGRGFVEVSGMWGNEAEAGIELSAAAVRGLLSTIDEVAEQWAMRDASTAVLAVADLAFELGTADASPPTAVAALGSRDSSDGIEADPVLGPVLEVLARRKQLILSGPPGTGKTYIARQLVDHYAEEGGETRAVTFHPSLAYEDFVEGLRPGAAPGGQLEYSVRDGHFVEMVRRALATPDVDHLMVIDEINRANLSRVLGELITVLETSKRAARAGQVRTQNWEDLPSKARFDDTADGWCIPPGAVLVSLAYSHRWLVVPENLHVLGTMNSTDRSIALMDYALRRRFHFYPLQADFGVLNGHVQGLDEGARAKFGAAVVLFEQLNRRLVEALGQDYEIGQSYLFDALEEVKGGVDVEAAVGGVVRHQIVPMLVEYFENDLRRMHQVFPAAIEKVAEEHKGMGSTYRLKAVPKSLAEYEMLVKSGPATE